MLISAENALELIAQEKYDRAKDMLKKLISTFPDQDELYNLYGYCNKCIEEICEKEDFITPPAATAPAVAPTLPKWQQLRQKGIELANKEEYKTAANFFGIIWESPDAEKPQPSSPRLPQPKALLLKDRAICLFLLEDIEGAAHNYKHAAQIELDALPPDDPQRIKHLCKIKNYTEALRIFALALQNAAADERADLYYQRYELHKNMGQASEAAYDLQNALKWVANDLHARPLDYARHHTFADWLIERGNLDQALAENAKAIALWPALCDYHIQRAEIYARLGHIDKSQQEMALLDSGTLYRTQSCRPAKKAKVYELWGELQTAEKLYQSETLCAAKRYDDLYDFYQRHNRTQDITDLRAAQRKEPDFHDRVSEREMQNLFQAK